MWREQGWSLVGLVRTYGGVVVGNTAATGTELPLCCLPALLLAVLHPVKGAGLLHGTSGLGHSTCGWNNSLPLEDLHPPNPPLSALPGAQVPTWQLFFPSYWLLCVSLTESVVQGSFCQSPVSFQIDVFWCVHLGSGEFHVLLLHHLDPNTPLPPTAEIF